MTADNQVTLEEIVRATPISSLVGKFGWNSHDEAKAGMTAALAAMDRAPGVDNAEYLALPRAEAFAASLEASSDYNVAKFLKARICCDGHQCGCEGSSVGEYLAYSLRDCMGIKSGITQPEPRPVETGEAFGTVADELEAWIDSHPNPEVQRFDLLQRVLKELRQQSLSAARAEIDQRREGKDHE